MNGKIILSLGILIILVFGCTQAETKNLENEKLNANSNEIQTETNSNQLIKSTAQTEGQLIQDLVKAIKKSFELN